MVGNPDPLIHYLILAKDSVRGGHFVYYIGNIMPFPPYVPDHVDDTDAAIELTSLSEMQRLLGAKGIRLHLTDTDSTDEDYDEDTDVLVTTTNTINEIIQRVSSRVLGYLYPRFDPELCSQNPIVREIATYWACHMVSRRRGNEPLYESEVVENQELLERYREGSLYLNVSSRGPRAHLQSYVIDNRFYRMPIRVIATSSTPLVPNQAQAFLIPFFWL